MICIGFKSEGMGRPSAFDQGPCFKRGRAICGSLGWPEGALLSAARLLHARASEFPGF